MSTTPMPDGDRRAFLSSLGRAGALLASTSWLGAIGYAQQAGRGPARAFARRAPGRGDFDRRVFGSFLEHLGRAVYTGVYQPGSRLADAKGFRTDVAREVRELGADRAVSGRQLRVRLQLARRGGPEVPAAHGARPCLELD